LVVSRPLAATHHAPTIAQAVDGAADKLNRLVASTLDKLRDHRARAGKPPTPDPDAAG
jgi:ribosome-associated translation inhibitor RaiA